MESSRKRILNFKWPKSLGVSLSLSDNYFSTLELKEESVQTFLLALGFIKSCSHVVYLDIL